MDNLETNNTGDFFKPSSHLPLFLLRAREAIMERFRPILSPYDITEQQWRVLRVLRERGELDASQLARAACILPPSLTRMVRSLEERELITSRKSRKDGRRAMINITQEGIELLNEILPLSTAVYEEIESLADIESIEKLIKKCEGLINALQPPAPEKQQ